MSTMQAIIDKYYNYNFRNNYYPTHISLTQSDYMRLLEISCKNSRISLTMPDQIYGMEVLTHNSDVTALGILSGK